MRAGLGAGRGLPGGSDTPPLCVCAPPPRLAKEELHRQELRQRVRMADNEVMDAFRKIMAARQKKRTPTKKEKDQAWKTLKERESILKLLDG